MSEVLGVVKQEIHPCRRRLPDQGIRSVQVDIRSYAHSGVWGVGGKRGASRYRIWKWYGAKQNRKGSDKCARAIRQGVSDSPVMDAVTNGAETSACSFLTKCWEQHGKRDPTEKCDHLEDGLRRCI